MDIKSNRRQAQLALSLAAFLVPFMASSLNLALSAIAAEFSLSAFSQTFLITVYLVGNVMLQMPAARLADMVGRRRTFLGGLAAMGLFTMLCCFAWSGVSLALFRFLCGVASAAIFATNMAIITALFPKGERGKALGVNTAVVYFAQASGPFLGGMLTQHLGWRSLFLFCLAVTVAALVISALSIKDEWCEAAGEPFDFGGGICYAVAMAGMVFGLSLLPRGSGWLLLLIGAVAVVGLVRIEGRVAHPMLKLEPFRDNRNFRLSALSAMCNFAAAFAIGFILSMYLQFVKGIPPSRAGLILMVQPVVQTFLSPLAGRLSDRVNPSYLTSGGMGCIAVALFFLSRLDSHSPLWVVILWMVMLGVGFGVFLSPNINLIMSSVPPRDASFASAAAGTSRQIGQSLSMAMTSIVVHAFMGSAKLTADTAAQFLPALNAAFLLFAGISLVGTYTSAARLFRR